MAFTQKADPQFSQPVRQIVMMLVVLGFAAGVGILLFPTVSPVFFASPYLNGFILFVFFGKLLLFHFFLIFLFLILL